MQASFDSTTPQARAERQRQVVAALTACVPSHALLWQPEETVPYECDGLTAYRERPLVVVLPETDAQVAAVLKACHALQVPVVARGAGTGLSGGAMPHAMGVTLSLAKFNRIVAVDPKSRTATVQCGVRNLAISEAAAPYGLYYAPDPSSQIACTIGGNVAENSGGVHCLKYGLTLHNVLRVKGYTVEGEPVEFGGLSLEAAGLDLLSVVVGSEGMLAITTEVTVKLVPKPVLARAAGATRLEVSKDEAQRLRFWSGRKNAFPASGRISPDYMCMDSTIPRKRLADILLAIQAMEQQYGLRCANVFHAGDGNLHPLILFDANDPDQLRRCELFGADILETSVRLGGTVTGEHGVGVEKLNSMCVQFSPEEREQMASLKAAFDPLKLLNPGKVIPTLNRCAEYGKMHVSRGLLPHPDLPRF
ncbi:MAG: FAD-binding protein [Betaproteobacteria bacterium]|nr:FAD-binding protein [Betaproteobacteria bacterium]